MSAKGAKPVKEKYYQRDHLYFLLQRWRSLLAVGILCALLAVEYTVYRNVTLWDTLWQNYEATMETYRGYYDDYLENKVALEFAIADCERQMQTLSEQQRTETEEYAALSTQLSELNAALEALWEPEEPEPPTWQQVASSCVQRAVIGFGGGVFVACLAYYYLVFCLKGRIYSAGDAAEITLLPNLGALPWQRKKGKLLPPDRWLQRQEGVRMEELEEVFYQRVASGIQDHSGQVKRLLLLGPVSLDQLQAVAAQLAPNLGQTEVDCAAHPAAEAVLDGCDAVVLAVKRGESRAVDLVACQEAAGLQNKTVIGTIVL